MVAAEGKIAPASSPSPATDARPRRRRTWWMLAVPAGALVVLLGFALHAEIKYRRRAEAISVLQELGNVCFGEYPPQGWLSELIGRNTQPEAPVYSINLEGDSATDVALAYVGRISELRDLDLSLSNVTDAGIARIGGLTGLHMLGLYDTRVTDTGLAHLRSLARLQKLYLGRTSVTDAGLAHIGCLTKLQHLDLAGSAVTDTGLAHLRNLTSMRHLDLRGTSVTDAGVAELKKHLPNTRIFGP